MQTAQFALLGTCESCKKKTGWLSGFQRRDRLAGVAVVAVVAVTSETAGVSCRRRVQFAKVLDEEGSPTLLHQLQIIPNTNLPVLTTVPVVEIF